jgi:hypothetical protein
MVTCGARRRFVTLGDLEAIGREAATGDYALDRIAPPRVGPPPQDGLPTRRSGRGRDWLDVHALEVWWPSLGGALRKSRPSRLAHETRRDDLIRIVRAFMNNLGVSWRPLIVLRHSTLHGSSPATPIHGQGTHRRAVHGRCTRANHLTQNHRMLDGRQTVALMQ